MSLKSIILTLEQNQKISIILKLKDNRFITYSEEDRKIRVYNRNYSLSYIINKIQSQINSMIQLENEIIICSSYEITILKLNKENFTILQILKIWTNKIIEMPQNNIIAKQNSYVKFICFDKDKYALKDEIAFEENVNNIIKINKNEICLLLDNYYKNITISIFDIDSKKIIKKISKIKSKESGEMCIIENKFLVVSLYLCLILIDIEKYEIINKIRTSFGSVITFCVWNNYTFFSGDEIGDIIEWKIEENKIVKKKEYNNGKKTVKTIIKFNNNLIAACSNDGFIKFYDIDS